MQRTTWFIASAVTAIFLSGCGSSSSIEEQDTDAPESSATIRQPAGPALTVEKFLEAVRTGNDAEAAGMFTELAREKLEEMQLEVAPEGSDTAQFQVGEVELVANGEGAHVATKWGDVDESGQIQYEDIIWILRVEASGWRIAGMATKVFPDEPPLFLNFEDVEDMIRKQDLVATEMQRRIQEQMQQARQPESPAEQGAPQ
jgi:hypothetical protein